MTVTIFAQFAQRYAKYNFKVFPCKESGKLPKTKTGFKEATNVTKTIEEWALKWPNANIGIATGEVSGIWVLDLDGEPAEQWLAKQDPLPITPEVRTGKGRHIYFKLPKGVNVSNSAGQVAPNVDVRGTGGYVIAPPSVHPDGGVYQWHREHKPSTTPFAEAPEWLLKLVIKQEKPIKVQEPVTFIAPNVDNADRYVKKVFDEEFRILATACQGTRNEQLFKSVAAMANYIGKGGATKSMVHDLAVAGARSNGLWNDSGSDSCLATIESALKTGLSRPKEIPPPKISSTPRPALSIVSDTNPEDYAWANDLLLNEKGFVIKKSLHNGLIVLERHPLMAGALIYNAFSDLIMFQRCPPWEESDNWKNRPIRDDDAIACSSWLEKNEALGLSIRPNDAYGLMLRVAKMNTIDPPRTWLESLKWDGTERISHWLTDYCSAAENSYTKTIARKWMISAVRRIMEPGCKADSMLILESKQGDGKSTALRVLGTWGDDCYFTDQVDDIGNKDALIQIQGVSIIEFAEMDTLNKADTDHIKKFITRQIDRYRPPYGRTLVDRPRRCVFAGTVNPGGNGYLKDPTGARRFWPVETGKILTDKLAADVPQLWAEAFEAWRRGEKNWIDDPEVMALATAEQSARYEEDAWAELIEKEIKYVDCITVNEIMEAISIPKERRDRRASMRIGAYLRHKGWVSRKDYRPDGLDKNPQRRFYAPKTHQPELRPEAEYSAYDMQS